MFGTGCTDFKTDFFIYGNLGLGIYYSYSDKNTCDECKVILQFGIGFFAKYNGNHMLFCRDFFMTQYANEVDLVVCKPYSTMSYN